MRWNVMAVLSIALEQLIQGEVFLKKLSVVSEQYEQLLLTSMEGYATIVIHLAWVRNQSYFALSKLGTVVGIFVLLTIDKVVKKITEAILLGFPRHQAAFYL